MQAKKKFRYTKQLVGMALRDGWTQKQIADACRTQQSIVSGWKSGAVQANEHQLKPLLELFGPRLRRKTFRVYHDLSLQPDGGSSFQLIKVEGEVIFSFPFRNKELCTRCQVQSSGCSDRQHVKKVTATRKLVVHALGSGVFCCLLQKRMLADEYQMRFPETNVFLSKVVGASYASGDLLEYCDSGAWGEAEAGDEQHLVAKIMLPMLIRKALLEHGYPVEGVVVHGSS